MTDPVTSPPSAQVIDLTGLAARLREYATASLRSAHAPSITPAHHERLANRAATLEEAARVLTHAAGLQGQIESEMSQSEIVGKDNVELRAQVATLQAENERLQRGIIGADYELVSREVRPQLAKVSDELTALQADHARLTQENMKLRDFSNGNAAEAIKVFEESNALRVEVATTRQLVEAAREQLGKMTGELTDWQLIAEGVKHDPRCAQHFTGDARWGDCLRCQEETARKRAEAAERQIVELRAELTGTLSEHFRQIPACYDTPADHYREMARRLVEDRDIQKHRVREAERQFADVRALCAVIQPWVMSGDVLFLLSDPIAAKRALEARGTPLSGEVLLPPMPDLDTNRTTAGTEFEGAQGKPETGPVSEKPAVPSPPLPTGAVHVESAPSADKPIMIPGVTHDIDGFEWPNKQSAEPATREPDLLAYMHATTTKQRDVAFLRTYAERIRNGTELTWEIPNTRAATITDIANRLERLPEPEQAEASRGDAPAKELPIDLFDAIHAVFTAHGIASRTQMGLVTDVIKWAETAWRQTPLPVTIQTERE